jgi:pimeloyl-ACP methyl ester carboxylesterase
VAQRLDSRAHLHLVDVPGFAATPTVDGSALEHVEDTLVREVSRCARPVTLAAHSLGCFVAYRVAATCAEQVAALVLIDGPPALGHMVMPGLSDEERAREASRRAHSLARLDGAGFQQHLRAAFEVMVQDTPMLDALVTEASRTDPRALAAAMRTLWTTDLRPLLSRITAPALLVLPGTPAAYARQRDAEYRTQLAGLAALEVEVVADARHFVMLDRPTELARLMVDFLERHGALDVA